MPALGSLRLTGFLSAIVTLCLIGPVATAAEPMTTDVFVSGVDGYHTYRIPGLVVSNEGTLLAFCEGRRNDRRDHGDIDMLLKRSTDGGRTWSKAILVYEEGGTESVTIGNPCPVVDRTTGTIWLPFCRDNDRVFVTSSDDDGLTWTPPREITATVKANNWDWYATGPGHGIQLQYGPHKGRLVIPCDCREKLKDGSWDKRGRSLVIYSDDQGQTWKRGQATELGMNECEVVERRDGTLLLSMRNYLGKNLRAFSMSTDGGETWSAPQHHPEVFCPTCQASIVRLPGDADQFVYSGPGGPGRTHMTLRLSRDGGESWPVSRVLYEGPAAYSELAVLSDETLVVLFEAGTKHSYEVIRAARVSPAWLANAAPPEGTE